MTRQITVRLPDDLADWVDEAESKTERVASALREARRREIAERIKQEYERAPADTPDDWGDPTEFSAANRAIVWGEPEDEDA